MYINYPTGGMERTSIVNITAYMIHYQLKADVKGECVTHVKYLYDSIKMYTGASCSVKPVMVTGLDGDVFQRLN